MQGPAPQRFTLPILHFNDVYRMTQPKPGAEDRHLLNEQGQYPTNVSFDQVIQFAAKLDQLRDRWATNDKGNPEGLVLFSGDLFSSSAESILTKGQNMVHIMNELAPDACVPGNHEFDFGLAQFTQLVKSSNFNWILSNVRQGANLLSGVREYVVFQRAGLRIGVIGVMSLNAYNGVNTWEAAGAAREPMFEHCLELSKKLRELRSRGGEECDVIIALTHAKHSEDIKLAHRLAAYSKNDFPNLANTDGVDIILGGHNHSFYCGKGVSMELHSHTRDDDGAGSEAGDLGDRDNLDDPDNHETSHTAEDTLERNRRGNPPGLLIVKSGADFRDLSEIALEVETTPEGSIRRKVVTSLKVFRHIIDPSGTAKAPRMNSVLQRQYDNGIDALIDQPIAQLGARYEVEGGVIQTNESAIGNWIADSILAREDPGFDRVDGLIMTAGSIKNITLDGLVKKRHILQMVPFDSIHKIIEVTGEQVRGMLEQALGRAPEASKGFPIVSRLLVKWRSDHTRNQRIDSVSFDKNDGNLEALEPQRMYRIMTNAFLTSPRSPFPQFIGRETEWEGLPVSGVLLQYLDPEVMRKLEAATREWKRLRVQMSTETGPAQNATLQSLSEQWAASDHLVWHDLDEESGLIKIDLSRLDGRMENLSLVAR